MLQQIEEEKLSKAKAKVTKPLRIYCIHSKEKQACEKTAFSAQNITLGFRQSEGFNLADVESFGILQRLQNWHWIAISL